LNRIPSLDGFRAISIILVLIAHSIRCVGFPIQLSDVARHGAIGVNVFFAISGFLITTMLLNEEVTDGKISIGHFYLRRAFRILPVFLLYTAFIIVIQNYQSISSTTSNLIHVLTFTVNFDPNRNWFLGHFWTLSVEEQFYLIWPVLLIFCRQHIRIVLVVLILYGCIARVIDYKFPTYSAGTLSPFFMHSDAILLGSLAAVTYFRNPNLLKHKVFNTVWLQILAVGLLILFIYLPGYGKLAIISLPFSGLVTGMCIVFLILCYLEPTNSMTYRFLNHKIIVHIGILSYSIYVWQQFFILGSPVVWYRIWPFNMLIIYLVALASYYLIERPFLVIRKRLFPSQPLGQK
jgi:peptidoglycan/LPS O-acetylase OafA/YrhL